jgi:phosphate butyryltransferase
MNKGHDVTNVTDVGGARFAAVRRRVPRALGASHRRGIVKPLFIFICEDGGGQARPRAVKGDVSMNRFKHIIEQVTAHPERQRAAVVCPDPGTMDAALMASHMGLVDPIFYVDEPRRAWLDPYRAQLDGRTVIVSETPQTAAQTAVRDVRAGRADLLLKGNIDTSVLLKQVVHKSYGLLTGRLITHVAFLDVPAYHKLLILTDGGMVTYPTLEQKRAILANAVEAMHAVGVETPKVACLAAVEKVNERLPETVDGAALKAMNERGELPGCVVEGPISFDLAFVAEAAKKKNYHSPVAGDADILLTPDFVSGNLLAKGLVHAGGARFAGMLVGASAPVVVTSRTAEAEEKLHSIACAVLLARRHV